MKIISEDKYKNFAKNIIYGVIITVLLVPVIYIYYISEFINDYKIRKNEVIEYETSIARLKNQVKNYNVIQKKYEKLKKQYNYATEQLPDRAHISELIRTISKIGLNNNIDFSTIRPENEIDREIYKQIPIYISLTCSFKDLCRFISKLYVIPRLLTLRDFHIRSVVTANQKTVNANFKAVAFYVKKD